MTVDWRGTREAGYPLLLTMVLEMNSTNLRIIGAFAVGSILSSSYVCCQAAMGLEQNPQATLSSSVSQSVETSANQKLIQSIKDKLERLKSLGGGIKPFVARLDEIAKSADVDKAADDLTALDESVQEQINAVSSLRNKPHAAPSLQGHGQSLQTYSGGDSEGGLPAAIQKPIPQAKKPTAPALTPIAPPAIKATYQGSVDGYYDMLVGEVLGKELGGLGFPCKGPFRLERFRLLQRIQEIRTSGTNVDGYLAYYHKIEEAAGRARKDQTRLPELSGNVAYLQQQLGLSTLTGSLHRDVK